MQEYISKNKEEVSVVLIVQFDSFHDYKGNINVANAYYITKLFINERNKGIVNFKRSYIGKLLLQHHRLIVLPASLGSHLMKTSSYIRLFLSTIGQIRETAQVMHVIVVGTLKVVDKDSEW
ncbi:hypothetical protein HanXRQr2_Chr05g0224271 [Helianthus annuus]|uniref:Uncharacterized protein n=1 Tax=Helianthus annuus TaxID=4232 RepID=A0A9K3J0S4_HELAN|nr:uncharacterized protein LOC110941315 [Helianthus annuus]KAF5806668.1 hypothetical protein HanXRQr2_Chr05g0224271 [Helianthus annuus]